MTCIMGVIGRIVPVGMSWLPLVRRTFVMTMVSVMIGGERVAERCVAVGRRGGKHRGIVGGGAERRRAADSDRQHKGDEEADAGDWRGESHRTGSVQSNG